MEVFKLVLEVVVDDELVLMWKGDKLFEGVIVLVFMLGLLGIVLGFIGFLGLICLGDLGIFFIVGVIVGIGEVLISIVIGLVVVIFSLVFYWLF